MITQYAIRKFPRSRQSRRDRGKASYIDAPFLSNPVETHKGWFRLQLDVKQCQDACLNQVHQVDNLLCAGAAAINQRKAVFAGYPCIPRPIAPVKAGAFDEPGRWQLLLSRWRFKTRDMFGGFQNSAAACFFLQGMLPDPDPKQDF